MKQRDKFRERKRGFKTLKTSRFENTRMYGVPDGFEKVSLTMVLLPKEAPNVYIEQVHRSGGPKPPEDSPPPSILAKLLSFKTKDKLLLRAWQGKRFTWQGNRSNLDHDYLTHP